MAGSAWSRAACRAPNAIRCGRRCSRCSACAPTSCRAASWPGLFERYGELRSQLGDGPGLAWQLRRFERDLLELLGYGLSFDEGEDGEPIDPAARYLLDAERGALRDRSHAPGSTSGAALLALAQDRQPPPEQLQELRGALRGVLATHLGPTGLKSWGLLSELARLGRG